ncbi:hypothetical protein NMT12_120102 [metagenome]
MCNKIMSKTGMISLVFWIISIVLVFQESPYWLGSILTISIAILIPMIKKMWDLSGYASNVLNSEKYKIS